MLFESWHYHLGGVILEAIALVGFGTAMVRIKHTFLQIVLAGFAIGAINFLFQLLPIQYGIHIPVGIIIVILGLRIILKLSFLKSIAATLFSFILLILIESCTVGFIINVLGYPEELLVHGTDTTKLMLSLPSLTLLIVLAGAAQAWMHYRYKGDATHSV